MLILSRRPGQIITIGDNVRFTVLDIVGDQVRIGFEAPSYIPIHRFEVYEKIKLMNDGVLADRIRGFAG